MATAVNKIVLRAKPFELLDVRLLDSPFKDAVQRDLDQLLKLEPDQFLGEFRSAKGLEPRRISRRRRYHLQAT